MFPVLCRYLIVLPAFSAWLLSAAQANAPSGIDPARNTPPDGLPSGVILVKGAWSGTSDSVTPLPEAGRVADGAYSNSYFGLRYILLPHWTEHYSGPPPSDSGYYVLAQIEPEVSRLGHILVAAQDLFFSPTAANSALELMTYASGHLGADYKVERAPTEVRIANHAFVRYDYVSPVAGLHWHVIATEIRCHVIQIIFTGRDTQVIEKLIQGLNGLKLPTDAASTGMGAGEFPVCIRDFAAPENLVESQDPILAEQRFNPIPVRIIIDTEGRVRHIHFLSAFPDQMKSVTDAVSRWRFRPYLVEGRPVEVETGIMFRRGGRPDSSYLAAKTKDSVIALSNAASTRRVAD
jgi:hypothetical protein